MMDWPKVVEEKVIKYADSKKLNAKDKKKFLELTYETYCDSKVPVDEPVGLLAAHSLGEPATQLILRTKHYAGAAEVSIGSGIERLEALVDARIKTKYPVMTIFISKGKAKSSADFVKYLKQLVYKKLNDVCEVIEELEHNRITVIFNKKALAELGLKPIDVKEKIKTILKVKPIEETKKLIYEFKDTSLATVRKYTLKISLANIMGVDGLTDAIISDYEGEKVIKTQGSNFKQVIELDFVDEHRTFTNDIFEVYKVLGVEAARNLLVNEIGGVYRDAGISVDARHVLLLADSMCLDGYVKGVVRTGIVSTKASPLARAAFEQTEKVLFDVSFNKETESFTGVAENVMAGLPINVGTGNIKLKMNFADDSAKKPSKSKK